MLKFSSRLRFSSRTLYQILDVPQNASQAQIKQNYLKIVKLYHPDTNSQQSKDQEYFKQVTAAYTILSNESKRSQYDQKLNSPNQGDDNFYEGNQEQNKSNEKQEQTKTIIILGVFFFFVWLNQKNKQKKNDQSINFIPNKYNPAYTVSVEKKQLSEQDCKDLPLDIIKYRQKQGDYKMGQLCYDRLLLDEQKILKKKKYLDDDFQQSELNQINSQVQQKSETIIVDQQQQQQIESATEKMELYSQNLESKEQLEEIRENEEQKQNVQQINDQISGDQTLNAQQEVNNNQFQNNSEQFISEQNYQGEQLQEQFQQQSQQENQQDK